MTNTLTITEHEKIKVEEERNISQRVISKKDKALLLEVTHKNRLGQIVNVFSSYKETIQAKSIVGSISIKSGLIIEILPKFAKEELNEESKKKHRKILLNMIRVSKEKNFISSTTQSSKTSVGEMPLIRYMIELFSESLLLTLRNSTFSSYSRTIKNSSYIKGNLLVSKTIQNNIIDKSKVYVSYNKHSMNNLLMQIFRTLAKILLNDTNLSYRAKQNLYEVYLLLDNVEIINIKQHDFSKITFNRLNHNFEHLFRQAEFIFNQYMPFTSNINSTPFWAILFNMDYLFEKFCAYLFRRSNIEIEEQTKIDCFSDGIEMVRMNPDFLLFENDKKSCVVDAKWKLLDKDKSLYGLKHPDFWQLFTYMNLTDSKKELNGYFIVPKYGNDFDDEIIFKPMKEGCKDIKILSIDFSLDFEDLIDKYTFEIIGNELKINILEVKKEIVQQEKEHLSPDIEVEKRIVKEEEFKFDFEEFIKELETLHNNKNIRKRLSATKKDDKFKNLYYLKETYNANSQAFKNAVKENLSKISWDFTDLKIDTIPSNIAKLKNIQFLNLSNNQIRDLPIELFRLKKIIILDISQNHYKLLPKKIFELKNLKKLIIDKVIIEDNIEILKQLKEKGIKIEDDKGNNLIEKPKKIEKEIKKEKIAKSIEPIKKTVFITSKNYPQLTKEEKQNFIDESDFTLISKDIIELIMKENDIDILEDFTYNKTLPLRFAFATYNNNLDREESEVARLKENLIKRNIKVLQWIIEWSIDAQENYIRGNITNINTEILLGYAMSSFNKFYKIREIISKSSNDLDILNELSKHRSDRPILQNIIFKTSNNKSFTKKIKNHKTIYSTEILNRIAHYEEYPNLQKLLLDNYNITNETREYLETQVKYQEEVSKDYIDEPFNTLSSEWIRNQ